MHNSDFTPQELRRLRALRTPVLIQRFVDELPYHLADTAWSPRKVLREGTAHCLEGALFAVAALRVNGFPPLLWRLDAVRDTGHALAIFRYDGHWGAIAKSNFAGLRFREPVYRTLRELAMSYFDQYYNLLGERTLRGYSRPVNLARFDRLHWMTTEKPIWFIPDYMSRLQHTPVLSGEQEKRLHRLDARAKAAGLVGHVGH
jgi:hypothetical protein